MFPVAAKILEKKQNDSNLETGNWQDVPLVSNGLPTIQMGGTLRILTVTLKENKSGR